MDHISENVKAMYEQYPYPHGEPNIRVGNNNSLLLSLMGKVIKKKDQAIQVLDAGCGRGLGLVGSASIQRHVQYTGVDMNPVGLANVKKEMVARNLTNIKVQEINLMTMEGLSIPEGKFDVIHSSGVIHHMSDPVSGLKKLNSVLAPQGVINLMVYGTNGRANLYRVIDALKLIAPEENEISDRIEDARQVAGYCASGLFDRGMFKGTHLTSDIEFVDRCLNVNETSYTIDALWSLIDECGLKFVKWIEPHKWDINKVVLDSALRDKLSQLSLKDQFKFIDQIEERPMLNMVLAKKDAVLRKELKPQDYSKELFALNPECKISETRIHGSMSVQVNELTVAFQGGPPFLITNKVFMQIIKLLQEQVGSFTGEEFFDAIRKLGLDRVLGMKAIDELLVLGVFYRPHKNCF